MWIYKQTEPGLFTVGFYAPDGSWNTDSDHGSREEAANRAAFLNGNPGGTVIVHLDGGLAELESKPDNIKLIVRDFDTEGADEDIVKRPYYQGEEKECFEAIYE